MLHITRLILFLLQRGEVANPRAPCVVTTIDPDYIKDAGLQRLAKKFRMKTCVIHISVLSFV